MMKLGLLRTPFGFPVVMEQLAHIPHSFIEEITFSHLRSEEVKNLVMNGLQVQDEALNFMWRRQPQHSDPLK
jgi:hypothetical protein